VTEANVRYICALEREILLLRRHCTVSHPDLDAAAQATGLMKATLMRETHGDLPLVPPQPLTLMNLPCEAGEKPETVLIVTLHGANRTPEVLAWHRRVMVEHFGLVVNYLQCPFPAVSHGACLNQLITQTVDGPAAPDYYLILDMDCVMLRAEAFGLAYQQVKDKVTVWGHSWQSNHKQGPTGLIPHPYASQACLMFHRSIYLALGRPDMDHWVPRSDTAEELTYAAKAAGYNVSLLYPSYSVLKDTPLDNGMGYGMGNTYGPLTRPLWHHTSAAGNPRHVEVCTETCKLVVAGAFEGDKPALPYGYVKPI
jgi:hypothetical protein